MIQPAQRPPIPDRPLLRLVWLLPASVCLWVLILAGFARLLENPAAPPPATDLVVSLAEPGSLSLGAGAGNKEGAGATGAKAPAQARGPVRTASANPSQPRVKHSGRPAIQHKTVARRRLNDERGEMEADAETLKYDPAPVSEPRRLKPMAASTQSEQPPPPSNAAVASAGTGTNGMGGGRGESGDGAGSAGEPDGGGDRVYDTVEHPPIPIARVLPVYPGAARSRGLEGEVVLRAIVNQHGAVEPNIVVVESVPLLDQAAIEALRQWRFEPGRDAGERPVRVLIEVPLRFRLR